MHVPSNFECNVKCVRSVGTIFFTTDGAGIGRFECVKRSLFGLLDVDGHQRAVVDTVSDQEFLDMAESEFQNA